MASLWTPQLNVALGALVVTGGAWLAWNGLSALGALLVMTGTGGFLLWRGRTIGLVWAWSTLFLGVECFAWPVITMIQIRSATSQPSDEEMGTILSAVLMGLFSAVFWIAFSYGLFKRAGAGGGDAVATRSPEQPSQPLPTASSRRRKRR